MCIVNTIRVYALKRTLTPVPIQGKVKVNEIFNYYLNNFTKILLVMGINCKHYGKKIRYMAKGHTCYK